MKGNLKNWLVDKRQTLVPKQLIQFAIQAASALSYLHSKNIVHGDVACRNLLISPDGQTVKLCDFGKKFH